MSHAIVMGGSIAGMCAAAALSRRFAKVTVLDRGQAPSGRPRAGVPQTQHPHCLYMRGHDAIERLVPGVFGDMRARGALVGDFGERVRWFHSGSWRPKARLDVDFWVFSRPLLERCIRERLASFARVELRYGSPVDAPIHRDGQICGVRLRDGEQLDADLVVDATGRGSRSPRWLREWGYAAVEEERTQLDITYMTTVLDAGAGAGDQIATLIHPDARAGFRRGGVAMRVESGQYMVSLFGYDDERAPSDIEGYIEWAKTLARPALHRLLSRARVVEAPRKHTMPHQQRRRFDKLRMPQGYLVLGDALCSLDPTFGQGMTVIAMEAEALLSFRPGRSTRRMQRKLAGLTFAPWKMTSGEAQRAADPTGQPSSWIDAALQALFDRAFVLAGHDVEVYATMARIMNFLASPLALIGPMIRATLRERAARELDVGAGHRAQTRMAELSSTSMSHQTCLAELSSTSMSMGSLEP